MRLRRTQPRQYATRYVAFYVPSRIRVPGAVAFCAPVKDIEVAPRRTIRTPWKSRRDEDEQQIVFHLGELEELARPIVSHKPGDAAPRFSSHRWTSRLALDRASSLEELFLETEPEWRLLEALVARSVPFTLEVDRPRLQSPEDPAGRAWFVTPRGQVQYQGAAGFSMRTHSGRAEHFASVGPLISRLEPASQEVAE